MYHVKNCEADTRQVVSPALLVTLMRLDRTVERGPLKACPPNCFVSAIFFSVFRGNTEINEYYPVVHYSEVLRLDVLVDMSASVHFFDGLNHLD